MPFHYTKPKTQSVWLLLASCPLCLCGEIALCPLSPSVSFPRTPVHAEFKPSDLAHRKLPDGRYRNLQGARLGFGSCPESRGPQRMLDCVVTVRKVPNKSGAVVLDSQQDHSQVYSDHVGIVPIAIDIEGVHKPIFPPELPS